MADPRPLRVVPADEAPFADLQAVLGARGPGARCQCQRYRLQPGESFAGTPVEVRVERLQDQTCGSPTSGLLAYDGELPVGWCAVAPRASYDGLVRVFRVPWEGRDEDRADPGVWAVTCVFVRAGHRRAGVGRGLVAATVPHARAAGARALEGYPVTRTDVISEELHVGTLAMFEEAGFAVVARPGTRRAVVRLEL